MNIRKLEKIAVTALEDIKAKDIEVINTIKLTSLFDRIILASGDSTRQVKALARSVYNKVKEEGGVVVGIEGEDSGEWVLVDLGDIVVHIMQPAVRVYYNIEELWEEGRAKPAPRGKGNRTSSHPPPPGGGGDYPAPIGAKRKKGRPSTKAKAA